MCLTCHHPQGIHYINIHFISFAIGILLFFISLFLSLSPSHRMHSLNVKASYCRKPSLDNDAMNENQLVFFVVIVRPQLLRDGVLNGVTIVVKSFIEKLFKIEHRKHIYIGTLLNGTRFLFECTIYSQRCLFHLNIHK